MAARRLLSTRTWGKLNTEPTTTRSPQELTMIGSPNTCSRCRFFTRNACSSRHCYDWRAERQRRREPDWEGEDHDDPDDEPSTEA